MIKKPTIKTKKNNALKVAYAVFGVAIILILVGYFLLYIPFTRIKAKAQVVAASAKQLKEVAKKNDIDLLKKQMNKVESDYKDFEKEAKSVYWATFIPQVSDLKNGTEAGDYMIKAGQQSIDAITPYADLIGFKKGKTSFVEKSAEGRLQTAVLTLDKMLANVDSISENVHQAEIRIAKIDPNRYPENAGKTPVRAQIQSAKDQFEGAASFFVTAKPFIKQLPKMLGKDKEVNYLILFQNENEQRPDGGFLTAFAAMKIKDGKIELENSSNIYDLDNSISSHPPAPDKIRMYHINVNQLYIRDSLLSPDFPTSVKTFDSLYQKSSLRKDYDAIVTMDTHVLVDMLKIFGDTEAGGVTFSANQDKRCDCPQVIYQMSDMVDRPVGYQKADRKGILGTLMFALFNKAIGFSPSKYWGPMAEQMFKDMDEKHILINFKDKNIQTAIEAMNYGGRVKDYDGDYLNISNTNFAGAKSNLFVTKDIETKTMFEGGNVKREVKITFRNPYPHSDCNLEHGNLCLNAVLRNWIRFYVPKGAKLESFKGSSMKTLTYDELGKTVFEGFNTVNPLGKAEVVITYTLPDTITKDNYKLLIQKQPGEAKAKLKVYVDNAVKFDAPFTVDKEVK
jgi:uncharacterized protein YbcV (DUF1398 family)